MNKLKLLLIITFVFITFPVYANDIDIYSNNGVLYNLNENKILLDKNKDEKVSIASLTKLMTALVAVQNIKDLNEEVSFDQSDYDKLLKQDAASSSLKRNRKHTYEELLYGLILESGADCANALARLTFGDEETFVKEMNKTAEMIGMKNTSFSNPIGLDNENNYSTVNDMAILLKEDLKNKTLNKIINSLHYEVSQDEKLDHTIYTYMKHYNLDMPYMNGGKTGYELKSGYALASTATKNNVTLMLITSKANKKGDHIKDAKNTYDYYFNNYDYVKLIKKDDKLITLKGKFLSKDNITITADKSYKYYMYKNYDKNDLKFKYDGIETLTLKNKKGEKIGKLNIYYKDKELDSIPIILNQRLFPDFKLIIVAIVIYIFIMGTTKTVIKRIKKQKHLVK